MSTTNNNDNLQAFKEETSRKRQELRQSEPPDREENNNSVNSAVAPSLYQRDTPRSNSRIRNNLKTVTYVSSVTPALIYTAPTEDVESHFNIKLSHRKDTEEYKKVPILPFIYLDSNSFNDEDQAEKISALYPIPSSTHRWLIPFTMSELEIKNIKQEFKDALTCYLREENIDETQIEQLITQCDPRCQKFDYEDFKSGRWEGKSYRPVKYTEKEAYVIDLLWKPSFPTIYGFSFTFNSHLISWLGHGPEIWPFVTLIKLSMDGTNKDELRSVLQAIPKTTILDIWELKNLSQWYIAVGMNDIPLNASNLTLRNARRALPGFLTVGNDKVRLDYADRLHWCKYCKPDFFHTRNDCPKLYCHMCDIQGSHSPMKCRRFSGK